MYSGRELRHQRQGGFGARGLLYHIQHPETVVYVTRKYQMPYYETFFYQSRFVTVGSERTHFFDRFESVFGVIGSQ